MIQTIQPFTLAIPQADLDDLRRRLDRTRWPDKETVDDWSQGAPLARVQALCARWRDGYDWRATEARLNALGQYRTTIDGLGVHFLHVRSKHENALPLLITHGWPGSVMEFMKVIGPLTDPTAHGGRAEDAFHVIAPSLPGYGFSDKPAETGWGLRRIAAAWIELMRRLGYTRWVAQGGDWGAGVTTHIGVLRPPPCAAIHVNFPLAMPDAEGLKDLTDQEKEYLAGLAHYQEWDSGYAKEQSTRPQTVGYGLVDSPAGQAAWIYEKLWSWIDHSGAPEDILSQDEMIDNIMLYWLPAAGASSARLYWESLAEFTGTQLDLPVGVSRFKREVFRASRRWADRWMSDIIHWGELDRGGHFAAWEQPELFVGEVRACFGKVR